MIIKIVHRSHPFVQIDKTPLEDPALSWRAKGILAYLLSRPPTWKAQSSDLMNHSTDRKTSVRNGLRELRKAGYAQLNTLQDKNGRLRGTEWVVVELPSLLSTESPVSELSGNTTVGKPATSNNTKEIITHSGGAIPPAGCELFIGEVAKRLEAFLHSNHRLNGRPTLAKSKKQISWLLFRDLDGDKKRLKHVVKGYLSNDHDKYTPRFDSVFEFRQKFFKIERWVDHYDPPPPKDEYTAEYERAATV